MDSWVSIQSQFGFLVLVFFIIMFLVSVFRCVCASMIGIQVVAIGLTTGSSLTWVIHSGVMADPMAAAMQTQISFVRQISLASKWWIWNSAFWVPMLVPKPSELWGRTSWMEFIRQCRWIPPSIQSFLNMALATLTSRYSMVALL